MREQNNNKKKLKLAAWLDSWELKVFLLIYNAHILWNMTQHRAWKLPAKRHSMKPY